MRLIAVLSVALTLVVGLVGLAAAASLFPVFHEEAGRLVDQATDQLRSLGAQLEQHMYMGRGHQGGQPFVQPGWMMGPAEPSPAERPLITIMLHHRGDLGLTQDQVSRLEALRGDFAREAIRREADVRVAELDLADLLAQDPVDLTRVETKVRQVAQLRADLRLARIRTIEQGRAVLTPEQKTRLQSLLGAGSRGMAGPRPSAATGTRL